MKRKFLINLMVIFSISSLANAETNKLQQKINFYKIASDNPNAEQTAIPTAISKLKPGPISSSMPKPSNTPYPRLTSTPYPTPTSTPLPPMPPNEMVQMNIQFQSETCYKQGERSKMCLMPIGFGRNYNIELTPISNICNSPINDGNSTPTCPADKKSEGHWIELYNGGAYGKRYIGIITITKTSIPSGSDQSKDSIWYSMEVEILSKSKTVAKMTTSFSSWSQLQGTMLLAEEEEDSNYSTRTVLRFGPAWNPNLKQLNSANTPPIKWNVIRGKLLE